MIHLDTLETGIKTNTDLAEKNYAQIDSAKSNYNQKAKEIASQEYTEAVVAFATLALSALVTVLVGKEAGSFVQKAGDAYALSTKATMTLLRHEYQVAEKTLTQELQSQASVRRRIEALFDHTANSIRLQGSAVH